MNKQLLEKRLREKIPTATPRPGFETRIQAMAREPHVPEKKSLFRRYALPALALAVIGLVLSPKDRVDKTPIVEAAEPKAQPIVETNPVQREVQGLKNDAKWTMGLFQKALPSIPVEKIEEAKK